MKSFRKGLLMAGAAALLIGQLAYAQVAPTYDATSAVNGEVRPAHTACVWVQPKDGNYGLYDTDKDPVTGATRVCIPATVSMSLDGKTLNAGGGGGGGGGAFTYSASASPTAVTAGSGKAVGGGLFSNLWVTPVSPSGSAVDLSAPSAILGQDGSTIHSASNPLAVSFTAALPAGTNLIGKVGLDQTTPGTTNGVVVNSSALPTGAATEATLSGLSLAIGSTTLGQKGVLAQCAATTGNPTYTTAQTNPLSCDQQGGLRVALSVGGVATPGAATNSDSLAVTSGTSSIYTNSITRLFDGTNFARARAIGGSFGSATGVAAVEYAGSPFANITTATTTTVKSGAGIFHALNVNLCVASATITMYDNTAASGTKIGTYTCPATVADVGTKRYDVSFATGLTIVTSAATDLTVSYR